MLDKSQIGKTLMRITVEVEKGRLRSFAKAIGETNAIYIDEEAAKAAGYRSLPVPPTYYFCLPMLDAAEDPVAWLADLGANLHNILHGEQSFEYFTMAFAGDRLTFESRISDIYDKKGGALEFVVTETTVMNQANELVAKMKGSTVIRHPGGAAK